MLSSGSVSSPIVLCVEAPCEGDTEKGTYHGNGRILRPSVAKVLGNPGISRDLAARTSHHPFGIMA